MKNRDLNSFFNPNSIAIIGASEDEKKVGGILVEKLKNFKGEIILINPKHDFIRGVKCFSSVLKYPKKIDLAIIAIPSEFVKNVLIECGKKEIKNVIIISSGFSEIGEKNKEEELIEISEKYKINLLGPNCFGIVNSFLNLDCTFANSFPKKGDTAFISQSGALWSYLSELKKGFSGFVSLGNMSDLDFSDWIKYFDDDKNTKKIVLYIEKIKDGEKFIKTCKNSKKKIFAIKSGKTEKSLQATLSHTGSLATDYEIYRGALKQANVTLKNSLKEIFSIKEKSIKLINKKIILITNAGGVGALLSDYFSENKIIGKPIDILGTAKAEDYKKELEKHKKFNGTIIVIFTPQTMSEPEKTAEVISKFSRKNKKNFFYEILKNSLGFPTSSQQKYKLLNSVGNKKKIIAYFLGDKSVKKATEILRKNKIKCVNYI